MRSGIVAAMSGVTVAVIGIGLRTGTPPSAATASKPPGVVSGAAATPSPSTVTPTTAAPRSSAAAAPAATPTRSRAPKPSAETSRKPISVTVNGSAVDTEYGPVQVQVTITSRRIVRVTAIEYPQNNGRDRAINSYAIPQLNGEAVQAQNGSIDTVSGATFTSDGYRRSLQAALDAAHAAGAR